MTGTGIRITLGVTGSIAAYKAVELLRLLARAGHDVHVVQTPASREFIGGMTFQALSGHPVVTEQFDPDTVSSFAHIDLASADLMLVAPATADTIGKMAAGIADNLLLSTYLATAAPVVICPAMNQRMWNHAAVRSNVETLRNRGVIIVEPGAGELACGEEGAGRMAEPEAIAALVAEVLFARTAQAQEHDLSGLRILVTAGGTREPIDSVRFITNRSSGRMGFALAEAAHERGAEVTVIAANCALSRESGIRYIDVSTATELEKELRLEFEECDVLLMAAAVSDYKVSDGGTKGKLEKKEKTDLRLEAISDIVSGLNGNGSGRLKVGFSAEYGEDKLERARGKLSEKSLGMMIFNDISRADIGFESSYNEITIMTPGGEDIFVEKATKRDCAERILDQVAELLR